MDKSPVKKNPRGAFLSGIWHFYTCQKSQPKRCKFFLWDDDAKVREEATVLNNSRSEAGPKTPMKPVQAPRQHATTRTPPAQRSHHSVMTPTSTVRPLSIASDETDFEWSASNEKALLKMAQTPAMVPPETPRKTPRTAQFTSPGKRNHCEMLGSVSGLSTSVCTDDVFNTPRSSQDVCGLLSPVETPSREKLQRGVHCPTESDLAADVLRILEGVKLSNEMEQKLVELLNKHDLRTQGIAKGRDVTRLALGSKERKIAELEARIAGLEGERETNKAVIAHLKRNIVQTSPSKSRKSRG
ncbi:hypothetical protein EPUS_02194 [Endocarpon pusillum Z07020]|uniref:Zinc finger GRF-type domain-containing protein n=1 Tax=Endocarpon pusillum (strain Z07020 / HMAS-L-300199) TaxID=1263415 RepID=U1G4R0_ENDPU|nr:uncharacterized protein EPUS_02194 [Endocarpon pusillum Z07020]ERF72307.1 hypothetical protein EPUS_02194 [Endocarpon pusillum Z07020]